MFALAMMALVIIVVTIGASFFRHLRDYSSDVYDKVSKKTQKPGKQNQKPTKDDQSSAE